MGERDVYPAALARALGLSQPTVHNYVAGRVPRAEELYLMARYFRVSMEYLLGVSDERGVSVPAASAPQLVRDEPTPWNGEAELRSELAAWQARAEAAERQVAPILPPWAWTLGAAFLLGAHWIVRRRGGLS